LEPPASLRPLRSPFLSATADKNKRGGNVSVKKKKRRKVKKNEKKK
jgi:hypothetical protein